MKKVFIILLTTLFIISCQVGKEDLKNFSADYTKIVRAMKEKMAKIKERDEFSAFKLEKQKAYETLLKKYEKSPNIEGIELLRCRCLIELEKYAEAEKKIDMLLAEKLDDINEAKMMKALILIKMAKYNDAYLIFKEIESMVKNPEELYEAYFYFAFMLDDNEVKKLYSEKFLNAKDLPEEQKKNRYLMYSNLAAIAAIEGKSQESREILKKGIAETTEERSRLSLEKQMGQLDFIGKEAIPIAANKWLNCAPIKWKSLKGKVIVIYFWAPWCPPCRALLPAIVDEYNKNKDNGLMVIGITKLTGKYEDDEGEKGQVNEQEELDLIKKYMARKGVEFPVVYTGVNERVDLDNYKTTGIPTQVFINKKGICDFIKTGSGGELFIRNRIKKLLAE